jgi:hypothetical protein
LPSTATACMKNPSQASPSLNRLFRKGWNFPQLTLIYEAIPKFVI